MRVTEPSIQHSRVDGMRENTIVRHRVTIPLIAVGIAALASACGGSGSGGSTASVGTNSGGGSTAAASATSVHSGPNGQFVTDTSGRTLYIFSADTSAMSHCSGACATTWPLYMSNGSQVVYKGHPVYYFAGDSAAGDTKGEGINNFGGLWTMVKPDGTALTMSQPNSTPSSSGGSSSEWG
jgi:predicted lipoprotein with Yx(FWY)xxD motif